MSWGIGDKATEKEKIFAEFNDCINGLNCVGKIDYDAYSQIYDFGRTLADCEYEQGKADERKKILKELFVLSEAHSVDVPVVYGDGTQRDEKYISLEELHLIMTEIKELK